MGLHSILKKLKQKEKEVRLLMLKLVTLHIEEPYPSATVGAKVFDDYLRVIAEHYYKILCFNAVACNTSGTFRNLGLDNAGKTTVVKRFCGEDISKVSPTYGFNIKSVDHTVDNYEYKLNIWDVGGQTSLRSYWRNYFECTDGLIWVVDSADVDRLEDCRLELRKLLEEERLAGATLLVFANKQDLPEALNASQICEVLDLNSLKTHHWYILPCSAVTGENLISGIDWLLKDISARIFTLD